MLAGAVITVFSAADYPQFQYEDPENERFNNKGAIVILAPPNYCDFEIKSYEAAPRPAGRCYFDLDAPDSADELPEYMGPLSDCEDKSVASKSGGPSFTDEAVQDVVDTSDSNAAEILKNGTCPVLGISHAGPKQCNSEQVFGRGHRSRVMTKRPW